MGHEKRIYRYVSLKKGLGWFTDLRGSIARKRVTVFLMGLIPQCTLCPCFSSFPFTFKMSLVINISLLRKGK